MKVLTKTTAQRALRQMKAVVINQFGGIEKLYLAFRRIPPLEPDEILIQVEMAGVGEWDPFEREGGFAEMFEIEPKFPYVLGSDGAGTVVAVGSLVKKFKEGDRVYALSLMNPKGGFYARYIAINQDNAALIPDNLPTEQAGAMPMDALTALQGLDDTLGLKPGESLLICGASGGIGHLAVQLAKRLGARVLAVASGDDGVSLVRRLGADAAIDGHKDDIIAAARAFAPDGLDAVLLTTGGDAAEKSIESLRQGGRAAYPNGVEPKPNAVRHPAEARPGLDIQSYDGRPDPQTFDKLNRLIESGPFTVHISKIFHLDRVADAHRALENHHLGKIALKP